MDREVRRDGLLDGREELPTLAARDTDRRHRAPCR
jgi:hypothetical protein